MDCPVSQCGRRAGDDSGTNRSPRQLSDWPGKKAAEYRELCKTSVTSPRISNQRRSVNGGHVVSRLTWGVSD